MANPPLFAVSASVFLHHEGQIVIVKRARGHESGGWFIPGGHIEYGESPAEAACRETREEVGLIVQPAKLQLLETYTLLPGAGLHHLGIVFRAPYPGGEIRLNEEHSAYRWVSPVYYRDRFLDSDRLRSLGMPETTIQATSAIRRVTQSLIETFN